MKHKTIRVLVIVYTILYLALSTYGVSTIMGVMKDASFGGVVIILLTGYFASLCTKRIDNLIVEHKRLR